MAQVPTLSSVAIPPLRTALLKWYDSNRRDLPWRETKDPYRIWVSEIMLQQTRVAAVLEHYRLFLERFPTVEALAAANQSEVLAAWSGLGYYRRARALHEAAKAIVELHNSHIPQDLAVLRSLPGIGRYTGAAIASIAFGSPVAVVDGNVERVASRLVGSHLTGEQVWTVAQQLLAPTRAGDWNQAIMELGATICLPVSPNCGACPLRRSCSGPATRLPKNEPERVKRTVTLGLSLRRGSVYLVKRAVREKQMAGMWELPLIECTGKDVLLRLKHSITVTDFDVHVVRCNPNGNRSGKWVPIASIGEFPITGLTRKILCSPKLNALLKNPNHRGNHRRPTE